MSETGGRDERTILERGPTAANPTLTDLRPFTARLVTEEGDGALMSPAMPPEGLTCSQYPASIESGPREGGFSRGLELREDRYIVGGNRGFIQVGLHKKILKRHGPASVT